MLYPLVDPLPCPRMHVNGPEGEGLTVVTHVPGAEIIRFIHINPDAIQWDLTIEVSDLLFPPSLGLPCKKIWVIDST